MSALRKALGNGALVTHGHGYALTVAPGELDADEFEALSARGRAALADGDAGEAADLLREALALWRGPALGELAYDLPAAAGRLEDLRLSATEDRIDADLGLGRHAALVAELAELVERHPERERLRGQQMLALYRCDRQADALAAYQDYRRRLGAELGLAPAPALRALEQAILEHDPALAAPAARFRAPRAPRRPAIAAAAAIALVALVALLARDGPSGAVRPEPVRVVGDALAVIDPATNRVTASYPVGATPSSASVGAGAVWTVSADAKTISRTDLRDRTTRPFGTGSIPLEVAATPDALWLLAADAAEANGPFAGSPALLSRIDPDTGGVSQSTPMTPRAGLGLRLPPGLVAVSREAVWAIGRKGRLLRLDRQSGATRTAPRLKAVFVAAGADQVWVVAETRTERQSNLLRLDPDDGRVIDRVRVQWASAASLAIGAGAVWVTDPYAGLVWRIDLGPQAMQQSVQVDLGVDSVTADTRSVWAANSVTGTVSRIDPATKRVIATVSLGGTPRSVALGAGRVWVAVAGGDRAAAGLPPGASVRPLETEGCGKPLTASGARPDLLIAADLPKQGRFTSTSLPVAAAIAHVLRAHDFRAGRFRLALQVCDDSVAQTGGTEEFKCVANAKAYAANPAVIGVVGPIQSFCAAAMLPILNRAPDGPVSVVSPTNSHVWLTRPDPEVPWRQTRTLYPTGQRGYARVYPADDTVLAGTVVAIQELGATSAFYLYDEEERPWRAYFRAAARRAGLPIKGEQRWDPDAANFRALARRVRESGAQAVVLDGSVYFQVGRGAARSAPHARPGIPDHRDRGRAPDHADLRGGRPGRARRPHRARRHAAGAARRHRPRASCAGSARASPAAASGSTTSMPRRLPRCCSTRSRARTARASRSRARSPRAGSPPARSARSRSTVAAIRPWRTSRSSALSGAARPTTSTVSRAA